MLLLLLKCSYISLVSLMAFLMCDAQTNNAMLYNNSCVRARAVCQSYVCECECQDTAFFSSHYFVFIISKYFICICLVRGILDVFGCVCKMSNAFYTLLNVFYSSRKISIRYSSDHLMNPAAIAVENRIHNSHIHTGRDRHDEIQHIMA